MLAADTDVQLRIDILTKLDSHLHELAYAALVELGERVILKDLGIIVCLEELARIVTGEAVGHLGKIVGSEAEEVCVLRDLISSQGSSRDLDHGSDFISHIRAHLLDLSIRGLDDRLADIFEFLVVAYQRDHDLRLDCPFRMSLLDIDRSADNCQGLHLGDLRIGDIQTDSAMSHHRVELMQRIDDGLDGADTLMLCLSQLHDILFLGRNKLMQRRIQETDRDRRSLKSLIQLLEVVLLNRKDLLQSFFSLFNRIGDDHLTECFDTVLLKEHMLCSAQTDSLCAELMCSLCVSRSVSVGADLQSAILVCPAHDAAELAGDLSFSRGEDAFLEDLAAIDWGRSRAAAVVKAWRYFEKSYRQYPMNVMFSYYGPMHDSVVWALQLEPKNFSLPRSWQTLDPTDGDRICESLLSGHTLDEAVTLAGRMVTYWNAGLRELEKVGELDENRKGQGSVAAALGILFSGGRDILEFYQLRDKLGRGGEAK